MRGRPTVGTVLVALLTNLALAGCAAELPDAVDRDLTDDWVKVAQVEGYVPDAGKCLDVVTQGTGRYTDLSVDCSVLHYAETVHVGRFPEGATRGAKAYAAAYAECDVGAKEYIGRPWWDGLLFLRIAAPTDAAWDGGARWFRCDVLEVSSVSGGSNWVKRTGSLKDGIPANIRSGCEKYDQKRVTRNDMATVPCGTAHNAEFVGLYRAAEGTAYPASERQWDVIHRGCYELVAKFLGTSVATARRWGVVSFPLGSDNWAEGDRQVRCWMWFGSKTLKKSAKGTGGKGLPAW
ncbi:septum formation family protein [Catellatospora sp. NPDC049609]|uniref:septum formation family protein n=1 Tax=Catellatospora sp. NPDC049609 TaxID=3155505 RepID=UPI0034205344